MILHEWGTAAAPEQFADHVEGDSYSMQSLKQTGSGRFLQLRFSPDGQYAVAQHAAGLVVLSVRPFHILFRVSAVNISKARFTPNGRQLVFVRSGTRADSQQISYAKSTARVERWNIATQSRIESSAIPNYGCGSEELSPDGLVLACVDFAGTLRLVEVVSGRNLFEKRRFGREFVVDSEGTMANRQILGDPGSAMIDFSPDGRFVIASPLDAQGSTVVWDLKSGRKVPARGG